MKTFPRNQQILQMRQEGFSYGEVASEFGVSNERVRQIEKRDCAEKSMAERSAKLGQEMRAADNPEKLWPINGVLDAMGLTSVTKKRLLDHFAKIGKRQIRLREMMDMCLKGPPDERGFRWAPLPKVYGVGKYGFRSVVNGFTKMDMGTRCNEEWRGKLMKVKQEWGIK